MFFWEQKQDICLYSLQEEVNWEEKLGDENKIK